MITEKWAARLPTVEFTRTIRALQIRWITPLENGGAMLTPRDDKFSWFLVSQAFMDRFKPEHRGYYLVDGLVESYCSETAFIRASQSAAATSPRTPDPGFRAG